MFLWENSTLEHPCDAIRVWKEHAKRLVWLQMSLSLQGTSVRRMRVERLPSFPHSWMTSWVAGLCSTGSCRTVNPTPSWGTSSQDSSTRWGFTVRQRQVQTGGVAFWMKSVSSLISFEILYSFTHRLYIRSGHCHLDITHHFVNCRFEA